MTRGHLLVPALLTTGALVGGCTGASAEPERPAPAAAPAAATDTDDLPDRFTEQELNWADCPAPDSAQGDDGTSPTPLPDGADWECATLTAPLDYTDPDGETIDLAMVRARSEASGEDRIGSLLFNFGGPGGSGVVTLPAFGQDYADLRESYDLVSFDPRGVGASEGVRCLDDEQLDEYFAGDPAPRDRDEERAFLERLSAFAEGCDERSGALLPHLTTTATARDLDLMRQVLGDARLHYFGISYGTELGGVYAHLFPQRVGRAVFDAVVDPSGSSEEGAKGQARGFQLALDAYLEQCAESEDCPLGQDPDEAEDRLTELLSDLRADPMPTRDPDDRPLTEALAWGGIAQSLYSEDFWPYLTQGLDDALADVPDGTVLLALGDAMNGRNPDGSYTSLQSALTAINCADSNRRYDVDDVHDALDDFEDASEVFGPAMAWGLLTCSAWPVDGAAEHPDVSADGAAPILLIGTTGDPATPYEGTERMADALGDDVAVRLTYEGEGHGAYNSGDSCVRDATNTYLLTGELPEDGTTCD
ncbi:alpha/beta hydrolase [Streptomyces sp. DSM 44915]|uniref:Alpha/beta hydrolase n=1 Tax=Streptomyces chisholmiae TaxID=3075540 RepID=A0ABU2JL78_9ACTN|nr:alpha/beta hydrolase [Streptomyces sp. DSM 44915]MDT0265483.1 alpha/beta hydrolase [Streptomyces sp. DSM 44915]